MTYLSVFEKFKILFESILNYKFILVFIIAIIFLTILYLFKKINVKKYITMIIVSFMLVFSIIIIGNYDVLYNTFDDFDEPVTESEREIVIKAVNSILA